MVTLAVYLLHGCSTQAHGCSSALDVSVYDHVTTTPQIFQVSTAMGFGFRCGFLGLLHMEIVQERLEREYDLDLIITAPTVVYKCAKTDGTEIIVDNPSKLPDAAYRDSISEPFCRCAQLALMSSCRSAEGGAAVVEGVCVGQTDHYPARHGAQRAW